MFTNDAVLALPAFCAFTVCNTVSCFYGRSKNATLDTWKSLPEITLVFIALSSTPHEIRGDWLPLIERFVILLYDRMSRATTVNKARKEMFTRKGRKFNAIPPTHGALVQHVKQTGFQAGHIWGQSLVPSPSILNPQEWGWISDTDEWRLLWVTLPEITKACQELVKCGCRKVSL